MASSIRIKPQNKGKLHEDTGTPPGQKIPLPALDKAKHSASLAVRRRATFAKNAKEWDHSK